MLKIENLHAQVADKKILNGINLKISKGEVHAIMGPNGSGKSTLAQILAGHPSYEVTEGNIYFDGKNLFEMDVENRAKEGIFMAFQYPVEIAGVSNSYFLRTGLNEIRKYHGEESLDAIQFLKLLREKMKLVEMDETFIHRPVNQGYSGGEKKRNEILQMAILNPKLAILDETDSGLDIDALRIVANGVNSLRSNDKAILLVTHYQRLLNYIIPDFVHVLMNGVIVKSGGKDLALELEKFGYDKIKDEVFA
ncbi:MAG: Fe-S cluster assembly ATPase SufC [Bacteroidota bacterium]